MKESLYIRVIIQTINILNHRKNREISPRYKSAYMVRKKYNSNVVTCGVDYGMVLLHLSWSNFICISKTGSTRIRGVLTITTSFQKWTR